MRSFNRALAPIAESGPEAPRVSLSARRAKEKGLLTSGTYGQRCSISRKSAVLQRFLENKLRRKTALLGSTLYRLTWKERVTPSGRAIFALRASAHRTSVSVRIGALSAWNTPATTDYKGGYHGGRIRNGKLSIDRLDVTAQPAAWTTPTAHQQRTKFAQGGSCTETQAQLAGYPTTSASDGSGGRMPKDPMAKVRPSGSKVHINLNATVNLAAYPTPTARDHFPAHRPEYIAAKKALGHGMSNLNDLIQQVTGPARLTVFGELLTGCPVGMENGGPLNPAHSRWLMGLPPVWDDCAPTGMPSSRRKQLSSAGVSASLSRLSTAISRILRG